MKFTKSKRLATANLLAADIIMNCDTEEQLVQQISEAGQGLLDNLIIEIAHKIVDILRNDYEAEAHAIIFERWVNDHQGQFALTIDGLEEMLTDAYSDD